MTLTEAQQRHVLRVLSDAIEEAAGNIQDATRAWANGDGSTVNVGDACDWAQRIAELAVTFDAVATDIHVPG